MAVGQERNVIYYPIREDMARRAKEMNSFSGYHEGTATAEYQRCVDQAVEIANRQKEKVDPIYHGKIDALVDTYARKLADNMNQRFEIDARVPSVMIAGPANFPTGKKEKQNIARGKNMEEWRQVQDEKTVEKNRQKEKEAFKICQEKIRKHGLDMKLIEAEYTFDNNKVLFYFTADGRIDFRELVKDLAAVFRTRIELRQIGVRDETKIRGGIGICGRPLCCSTYLTEFAAVSIKMAKEQNLSLNPTKISGVCGRLMCCLTNEEETYEVLNSQLPSVGDNVTTSDGLTGTVHSLSVLRRLVKVIVNLENDEKEIREYKADDLKFRPRRKKQKVSKEEQKKLAALERMEKKEGASKLDDK